MKRMLRHYLLHELSKDKRDAGKPETLNNRTERNGTEPEVIDAQYGRGRRILVGVNVSDVRRTHLAFCTSLCAVCVNYDTAATSSRKILAHY